MPRPGQYGHCSQDQVKKFYLYKMPVLGFIPTFKQKKSFQKEKLSKGKVSKEKKSNI